MSNASCARRAGALALAVLCLAAQAQVNKCTQADGSVSFQSGPCGAGEPRTERVSAAQLNAAQHAREARARAAAASAASGARAAATRSREAASRRQPASPAKPASNNAKPSGTAAVPR